MSTDYNSSVSATFLRQLFADRTNDYVHVISMYDPKKEYFPENYDSSHLPCFIPLAEQTLSKQGLSQGNRKIIPPHVILHQPVSSAITNELIERKVSKLPDDYRGWFVTLFTTDSSGKRTAKNTIDPLAIVADYDRGIEPPTDEQLVELDLPLPTVRVQSGGGYHLWWFLKEDSCTKKQRLEIMLAIVEKTGADPAMKDEARVLRLPGSIHLKNPTDPKCVLIIESNYERKFTYSDFNNFVISHPLLPKTTADFTVSKLSLNTQSKDNIYIPPIPLERCLSKEHREVLAIGVIQPGRDNIGCALARDLIGVANYVPSIQFDYKSTQYQLEIDGDPAQILWDYCRRCSPPLDQEDYERILKSAQEYNPSPSIRDEEKLKNCLRGWVKENSLQPEKSQTNEQQESKNKRVNHGMEFRTSEEEGLWMIQKKFDKETNEVVETEHYIGNHLIGIARVKSPTGEGASIYLEFKTYEGNTHKWLMPRSATQFETQQMLAQLLDRGYYFSPSKKKEFIEYLSGLRDIEQTYTITDQTGWVGREYVSQNKTYSVDPNCTLKFRDIEPIADSLAEIKGLLWQWQKYVGEKCTGNSRLIFGVGVALAAPLQSLLNIESGGFHLVGDTSIGKTTILKVAASVLGLKDLPQWRTTTNGLESIACAHNNMLLPLDEIGQADDRDVGAIAYMLANGQGKVRMTKNLTSRKAKTWQLLFLSSGEKGLAQCMALAGMSQKGGQEVRLPDIPAACSGSLHGAFETIHYHSSSKEFAESLDTAAHQYHGTLLDAFLTRLVVDVGDDLFVPKLNRRLREIAVKLATGTTDNAVARVSTRFALLQVALELAHSYSLLPFPFDHIGWAIGKMFTDWLNSRGGDGSVEMRSAINRIQHLLVINEFSDRIYTLPDNNDRVVRNLLGYRKLDVGGATEEFWIPPAVFDKEIVEGMNKLELIRELQRLGILIPPRSDGSPKHQRQFQNKNSYYFILKKTVKTAEGSEGFEDKPSNEAIPPFIALQEPSDLPSGSLQALKAGKNGSTFRTFNLAEGCLKAEREAENPYIYSSHTLSSKPSKPSEDFTLLEKITDNLDDKKLEPFHSKGSTDNGLNPQFSQIADDHPFRQPSADLKVKVDDSDGKEAIVAAQKMKVGDRVKIKSTGVSGELSKWYRDRTKATIEFDNGDFSDWIVLSDLEIAS
jgi:uncharacterized protein (DUF927 family)